MGNSILPASRRRRVAGIVVLLLTLCVAPCLLPSVAVAQDYEAMMPESVHRELRHAEREYRDAIHAVNAAETERIARKAAGAAEAELRALDEKVGQLVTKAEKLKVKADYLEELYEAKAKEYKNK
jgi:isocitrate/isopropylmalate dehydrogenase